MAFPTSPSNNTTTVVNGILYVYNSTNNSWKVVANTIIDGFARSTANAAWLQANTPSYTANSASVYANGAFTTANSAGVYANSAYVAANTADSKATSAGSYANAAFLQANTPSYTANSAASYANAAFLQANTPSYTANSAATYANGAFVAANSAGVYANAAFVQANTPSYTANSGASYANSAFIQANGAFDKANSANVLAQQAYDTANTKLNKAGDTMTGILTMDANIVPSVTNTYYLGSADKVWHSIFVGPGSINIDGITLSNTGSGTLSIASASGETLDLTQISGTANAAASYANSAFLQANTPSYRANSAAVYANGAFSAANTADAKAVTAGSYANAAFLQANTPSYTANSAAIYANGAFSAANTADAKAVTSGVYANAAFLQANTPSYVANSASSYANGAFTAANTASSAADSAGEYANGAFLQANTSATNALSAGSYANSAFVKSNGAFTAANSAGSYANAAFAAANTAANSASSATDSFARQTANAAFIQANNAVSYNTSIADAVTSIQVGGAAPTPASTWKTYTIIQALDAILFPTLGPSYTLPTISFSPSISGTYEIGVSVSQAMTLTGVKNDAGAFTQLRFTRNGSQISACTSPTRSTTANIASQFGYTDPNNQNYSYAASYTDTFTIVSGTTTWAGDGNYSAGLAKLDNKGGTDSNTFAVLSTTNPQSAQNNFSGGSASATGIYPYFWGVSSSQPTGSSIASDIAAGTTNKVVSDSTGSISITWNASGQYVWFATPASSTTKTAWYNTALNNGSIGSGQFILGPVTQNVNSPSSYWTGISYKIYISGFATTTSGSITLS